MSPHMQVQFNMELSLGTGIWIYTFVSSEITASEIEKPLSFDKNKLVSEMRGNCSFWWDELKKVSEIRESR